MLSIFRSSLPAPTGGTAAALPLSGLLTGALKAAPVDSAATDTPGEAELIAASRRGDEGAFAALVRLHQRRVFRLAGRFFARAEVEDVAQETFLTAWQKLDSYAAKAPFEHWLTRICLNLCYARLRRHRPEERSTGSETPYAGLAAPVPAPDARLEAERLLARLAPADRFVLQLLHGEGWSVAEIADRLGWTRANVKVRAFRARRRLRQILEAGAGEPAAAGGGGA